MISFGCLFAKCWAWLRGSSGICSSKACSEFPLWSEKSRWDAGALDGNPPAVSSRRNVSEDSPCKVSASQGFLPSCSLHREQGYSWEHCASEGGETLQTWLSPSPWLWDELCLPSCPVVSITLAQLWLGLAACQYFANQKADMTFIFLNERKMTFKYKWHQIWSNPWSGGKRWWGNWHFMCLTQEGKKPLPPLKQTYNKEPDWFITALMFNFGCII